MPIIAMPGRAAATVRISTAAAAAAGVAICLALALALRLQGLDTPSPWVDEIATWTFAHLAWADLLGPVAQVETNPPGHYALVKLLGAESVTALRLPSALAGAAAVLPVALVARRAGGTAAAPLAASLLALSAMQIHHAQQARGYALLFLAVATALWLLGPMLARATPMRPRLAAAGGFVLACVAALYLHATAVVMVAALYVHALTVLALRGGRAWRGIGLLAGAGLAILLAAAWWLRLAAGMVGDSDSPASWITRPDLADSAAVLVNVLGGFHLGTLKGVAGGLAALVLALGAVLAWRQRDAEALGLAAAFAFGVLALHALSRLAPMMLERTALSLLVFAVPLAAYALATLRPRLLGLGLAALLLALALRGTVMHAEAMAREGHGEDWRGALAALESRAAPGDIVLLAAAPELGALPWLAPRLALRVRVAPQGADRLDRALVATSGLGAWFDRAEACDATVWALARDLPSDARIAALGLPQAGPDAAFGRVVLRRIAMPPCAG